jgi:hypothetical protein
MVNPDGQDRGVGATPEEGEPVIARYAGQEHLLYLRDGVWYRYPNGTTFGTTIDMWRAATAKEINAICEPWDNREF